MILRSFSFHNLTFTVETHNNQLKYILKINWELLAILIKEEKLLVIAGGGGEVLAGRVLQVAEFLLKVHSHYLEKEDQKSLHKCPPKNSHY